MSLAEEIGNFLKASDTNIDEANRLNGSLPETCRMQKLVIGSALRRINQESEVNKANLAGSIKTNFKAALKLIDPVYYENLYPNTVVRAAFPDRLEDFINRFDIEKVTGIQLINDNTALPIRTEVAATAKLLIEKLGLLKCYYCLNKILEISSEEDAEYKDDEDSAQVLHIVFITELAGIQLDAAPLVALKSLFKIFEILNGNYYATGLEHTFKLTSNIDSIDTLKQAKQELSNYLKSLLQNTLSEIKQNQPNIPRRAANLARQVERNSNAEALNLDLYHNQEFTILILGENGIEVYEPKNGSSYFISQKLSQLLENLLKQKAIIDTESTSYSSKRNAQAAFAILQSRVVAMLRAPSNAGFFDLLMPNTDRNCLLISMFDELGGYGVQLRAELYRYILRNRLLFSQNKLQQIIAIHPDFLSFLITNLDKINARKMLKFALAGRVLIDDIRQLVELEITDDNIQLFIRGISSIEDEVERNEIRTLILNNPRTYKFMVFNSRFFPYFLNEIEALKQLLSLSENSLKALCNYDVLRLIVEEVVGLDFLEKLLAYVSGDVEKFNQHIKYISNREAVTSRMIVWLRPESPQPEFANSYERQAELDLFFTNLANPSLQKYIKFFDVDPGDSTNLNFFEKSLKYARNAEEACLVIRAVTNQREFAVRTNKFYVSEDFSQHLPSILIAVTATYKKHGVKTRRDLHSCVLALTGSILDLGALRMMVEVVGNQGIEDLFGLKAQEAIKKGINFNRLFDAYLSTTSIEMAINAVLTNNSKKRSSEEDEIPKFKKGRVGELPEVEGRSL